MEPPDRLVVRLLLGRLVVARFRSRVGHHGHRQLEVGGQHRGHRDIQRVVALLELHQLVVEHPGALERDQGQCRLFPPVEADSGRIADLVGVAVGQDSQPDLVFVVGDLDFPLPPDRVLEPVGPFGAEHVPAALFQLEGLPDGAVFGIGFQVVLFDQPLAGLALDGGFLQHAEHQLAADRLALGIVGLEGDLKGLAGHVDRADRAHVDGEPLGGQHEVHGGLQVSLREHHHQRQDLGFVEVAGGELELDLALVVGPRGVQSLVGQLVADLAAGQRGPGVEGGPDRPLDLFATVEDRPGRVDHQVDRLQLVLVDLEAALVAAARQVPDQDAIFALRAGRRKDEMRVEGAEGAEHNLFLPHQPAAAVEDLERVLLACLDEVGITFGLLSGDRTGPRRHHVVARKGSRGLGRRGRRSTERVGRGRANGGQLRDRRPWTAGGRQPGHVAEAAPHVDQLAGPIGGTIGVDVALVGEPLGDADPFQADHVRGHVPLGNRKHSNVARFGQLLVCLLEHAVVAGRALGKNLLPVGDQQPRLGPGLAGEHVLGKDEDLVAGTLDDHVQVAPDHQRGGLERLAADRNRHHPRLGVAGKRHFQRTLQFLVLGVVGHLELERLVGVDQGDVELLDPPGQVHLAEVGLQVDLVGADRDGLDVARGQLQHGRLVGAEDPLGRHGEGLGRQPGNGGSGVADLVAPGDLAILFQGLGELAELLLQGGGDHQLPARRPVGVGILRDQPAPVGDGRVPLLLPVAHLAKQVEDFRTMGVQRILGQELGPELLGFVVLLGLVLLVGHQVLGADDLALDRAPRFVRGVFNEVFLPGGEGLGEFLLQLVRHAQEASGIGHLLAVLVAVVGQEPREALHRVFVPPAMNVALGDLEVGQAGQLVLGKTLGERFQRGGAQAQLLVALRLGNPPGAGEVIARLGDPLRLRVGVLGQQVLPGPPGLLEVPFGQPALAQAIAGFDVQRAVGVLLDELLVQARRLAVVPQFLLALGYQEFHLGPLFRLGTHVQRLLVELHRLLVVGLVLLLGRLEVVLGKLQVDVGDLLLPVLRKQVLGLRPEDQLGGAEVALSGKRQSAGEPRPAGPGAVGELLLHLGQGRHRFVVLLLEIKGPALEIGQVVLGGVLLLGCLVDGLDGLGVVAVLHQLPDVLLHQGGV